MPYIRLGAPIVYQETNDDRLWAETGDRSVKIVHRVLIAIFFRLYHDQMSSMANSFLFYAEP